MPEYLLPSLGQSFLYLRKLRTTMSIKILHVVDKFSVQIYISLTREVFVPMLAAFPFAQCTVKLSH